MSNELDTLPEVLPYSLENFKRNEENAYNTQGECFIEGQHSQRKSDNELWFQALERIRVLTDENKQAHIDIGLANDCWREEKERADKAEATSKIAKVLIDRVKRDIPEGGFCCKLNGGEHWCDEHSCSGDECLLLDAPVEWDETLKRHIKHPNCPKGFEGVIP